ncbi:tetratricopeptide repeat protein [Roseibacillus persicicus]|uniref:Tetratricopeptide repeat protein n=1 Tax=Roseibacillus persicicus TaxID=454148 RepID=A0A918WES7_9BACT|nr:hypothetical protein [Roseibacillus persicicus]MDQ8191395.1 hypothetical protein [Roseibacillus persicicus]GHC40045.1 hypothetical protein GCM10007100_00420 [Roseibacillus persicicus]
MTRNLFLSLTLLGAIQGPVLAQDEALEQEEALKKVEMPGYMNRFSNLTEAKRQAYGQHKLKAEQFFRQKRTFEALDEIYQAVAIFDEDPGLWNLKGSCHVEFRSFNKAREAFQRALAIDEKNTGILFNLAEMDFVTKEWKACIEKMQTLAKRLEENADGEMDEPTLNLHHLALFKTLLAHLKLGQDAEARELAEANWEDWDDTPFTYYSKAALAYHENDDEAANQWIMSAVRVFGGLNAVANWQDTLIEFGYVKSFYGGEEEEIGNE